jgi:hypothetical protein
MERGRDAENGYLGLIVGLRLPLGRKIVMASKPSMSTGELILQN